METSTDDLAEHCRLIHLTLVAITAALLISLFDLRSRRVSEDLAAVKNLANFFEPDSEKSRAFEAGILESHVRELLRLPTPPPAPLVGTLRMTSTHGGPSATVSIEVFPPVATVFHTDVTRRRSAQTEEGIGEYSDFFPGGRPHWRAIAAEIPHDTSVNAADSDPLEARGPWKAYERPPEGIRQFARFWNAAANVRHAYVLPSAKEPKAYLIVSEGTINGARNIRGITSPMESVLESVPRLSDSRRFLIPLTTEWTAGDSADPVSLNTAILTMRGTWYALGYPEFRRQMIAILRCHQTVCTEIPRFNEIKPGDVVVIGNVDYTHRSLNLQEHFLSQIRDDHRQRGSFGESFPHLQEFVAQVEYEGELDYSLLSALITWDARRGGNPVELPGLKIDRESMSLWGVGVLIAVQLYLMLQLRELTRRTRGATQPLSTAWIALYPALAPFLAFAISAIAFPITCSVLVVWRAGISARATTALCVLSIVAAVSTVRPALALRKLLTA